MIPTHLYWTRFRGHRAVSLPEGGRPGAKLPLCPPCAPDAKTGPSPASASAPSFWARVAHATVDALAVNLAILDADGVILVVNRAWREFAASNSGTSASLCEGARYLSVCDQVLGPDSGSATAFAVGIRQVLQGRQPLFSLEYPCHSPSAERWFRGTVSAFQTEGRTYLLVVHTDITARVVAEQQQRRVEAQAQLAQKIENLGLLAGGMAHDLNLVLTDMLAQASAQLSGQAVGTPAHQAFAAIVAAALRGGQMLQNIQGFARQSLGATVQRGPAAAGGGFGPRTLNLFLVDDDQRVLSALLVMVEALGHNASTALSGEAALVRLEAGLQPDLVVLDANLPGLSGCETLALLRVLRPNVPVLLTTGRTGTIALESGPGHAFVTQLAKPFTLEQLRSHIEASFCAAAAH